MSGYPRYEKMDLLVRIAGGDEAACRELFHDFWSTVYGVAFMLTKSETLSEDLVQEIFLQVWLKREELPRIERFRDWLFILARNRILSELRRKEEVSGVADKKRLAAVRIIS